MLAPPPGGWAPLLPGNPGSAPCLNITYNIEHTFTSPHAPSGVKIRTSTIMEICRLIIFILFTLNIYRKYSQIFVQLHQNVFVVCSLIQVQTTLFRTRFVRHATGLLYSDAMKLHAICTEEA